MEEIITPPNVVQNGTEELVYEPTLLGEEDSFSSRIQRTGMILDTYYTPLLCLVGTLGNSLSLAVFNMDSKYRSQSASFYLSALAVSDTGFLLSLFAVWLEGMVEGGGVITSSDFTCSLVMYLGQVTCFLSVYLTVAFTIERYVAVHCPFSRPSICTRAKAKKAVACLTVAALVIFSYAWVIAKVIKFPPTHHPFSDEHEEINSYGHDQILPSQQVGNDFHIGVEGQVVNSTRTQKSNSFASFELAYVHEQAKENISADILRLLRSWNAFKETGNAPTSNDSQTLTQLGNHSSFHVPSSSLDSNNFDSRYICSVPEQYFEVSLYANYLDTIVTLIIPFFLITILNALIATSVWRLKNQRQSIVASPTPSREPSISCHYNVTRNVVNIQISKHHSRSRSIYQNSSRNPFSQQHITIEKNGETSCRTLKLQNELSPNTGNGVPIAGEPKWGQATRPILAPRLTVTPCLPKERETSSSSCQYTSPEVRVTKTLLLVSSVFLILNLPSHALRCAQFVLAVTGTHEGQEYLRAFQPWANILFNTNFAVNFLLYCVSGKNFRLSLHHLLLYKFGRGRMSHHRRKVIKGRLNHTSRYCSTALTSGKRRESCEPTYLRIELGTLDDASSLNGSSLNLMNEENEQIVPV